MKSRVISVMLAMGVAAALFAGCQTKPTDDQKGSTKITVSEVTHSVFYAPQYVAISQGFFEKEGLEVELINGQGADKVMTAVVSGQVDIGFSGPEAAIYVLKEGKADYPMVFAQLTKRDGSFLIGRQPDADFNFDKLKGTQLLGGRKGGVPFMTLQYVLRQQGLDPSKDLNVDSGVQFALMAGAFVGGQGDYVTLFEPTASAVEREGQGHILASIGELSGEIPYTCYYATNSYIAENPDVIQRFTNAIYKGQLWVRNHSAAEVAQAISEFFPDTDLVLLETVCQRHADIDAFMSDPLLRPEALDRLQTVMEQAGELDGRVDYDKLVDTTFAQKAIETIE
ncbi:MAG: ABC transporter substrate-binding protein [Candidatus Fimivivens sp.]